MTILGYIFIYVQIKHEYIILYTYFAVGGIFSHKKIYIVQLQWKYPNGQADTDNWRSG
jgi:uncharacterized membrane protein